MISSFKFGEQYELFIRFINDIRSGKNHLIISSDYVVMSRKAYDEFIKRNQPELHSVSYDEHDNWIKRYFIEKK